GKARSSLNALRHGMFCGATLLPGEDASQFHALRHGMIADLRPADTFQWMLVENIVADTWRIQRLRAAENVLYDTHEMRTMIEMHRLAQQDREENFRPYDESKGDDPAELLRCLDRAAAEEGMHYIRGVAVPKSFAPAALMCAMLSDPDSPLERFQRYESRLSLSLARNERMLRARQ